MIFIILIKRLIKVTILDPSHFLRFSAQLYLTFFLSKSTKSKKIRQKNKRKNYCTARDVQFSRVNERSYVVINNKRKRSGPFEFLTTVFREILERWCAAGQVNRALIVTISWRLARIYPNGRITNSRCGEQSRTAVDRYSYTDKTTSKVLAAVARSRVVEFS